MRKQKSQISALILISILILVLFVFLITQNISNEEANIDKDKNKITSYQDSELSALKQNIDYCLKKELQKALITSGLRGGFIYEGNNEYYFPGTIPTGTYSKTLISNLDLNWEYLKEQTLVHSQADIYTPGFDTNTFMYTHSIKEDLHKYVEKNFIKCLKFENLADSNLINYSDYLGEIESIDYDTNEITVSNTIGKEGDTIMIDLEGQSIYGTITSHDKETNKFIMLFDNLDLLRQADTNSLEQVNTINLNNSLNLTLETNLEYFTAQIDYPVKLEDTDFHLTYSNANIQVNVRYKELVEFAKILLREKYQNDKTIDYTKAENVVNTLKKSSYFKTTTKTNIELRQTILKNTDEEKRYIYSLIDENSKIVGQPFVFNFGYENTAPYIKYDDGNIDTIINLKHTPNSLNTYSLKNLARITDNQLADMYYHIHFIPKTKDDTVSHFSIDQNGNIEFKATTATNFAYEIEISDTETKRKYTVKFTP